jgi:hypothetical protein
MFQYRCHFLTSQGKIFCTEDITAETDDGALEKVRQQFAEMHEFPAFELWLGTTRIYSEKRPAKVG